MYADADSKEQSTSGVVVFTISLSVKGICNVDVTVNPGGTSLRHDPISVASTPS